MARKTGIKGWLLGTGLASSSLFAGLFSVGHAAPLAFHADHVLGTSLDIVLAAANERDASYALEAARAEIARLDLTLSAWRSDSELAALNESARFIASPDLFRVVAEAERMRALTAGHFSARLGNVIAHWRTAETNDARALAEAARLASAAARGAVILNPATREIRRSSDVRFDLDGIAKGYIIDRALAAARRAAPEAHGVLIDIGGDIAAWGRPRDDDAWRIGAADPLHSADNAAPAHLALLRNQSIATSGRGSRDLTFGGARASHLVSPFTGQPTQASIVATVIAPTTMQADALATAFSVMPAHESLALADRLPGVAAVLAVREGTTSQSGRWPLYATPFAQDCQAAAPLPATPWPAGFRVDASFEIPRVEAREYKRPYVSIWISDDQRRLVKTLLVLGDRARWRESNYVWWRRFERLDLPGVQAISRPTRAPGHYDLTWDGRDQDGKPVAQGRYTLNVEISREHGAHNVQVVPLDLGAAPSDASAPAQDEIGRVAARYGAAAK